MLWPDIYQSCEITRGPADTTLPESDEACRARPGAMATRVVDFPRAA
jgi:hypothetical protein